MRAATGLLMSLLVLLPFATFTAQRGTKDCCCALMRNGSCPLKKQSGPSCGGHAACSIDRAAATTAPVQADCGLRSLSTAAEQRTYRTSTTRFVTISSIDEARLNHLTSPPDPPPPRLG